MMGFGDAVASAGQSAPCSRQITTATPHNSIFYRLDAQSTEGTQFYL